MEKNIPWYKRFWNFLFGTAKVAVDVAEVAAPAKYQPGIRIGKTVLDKMEDQTIKEKRDAGN